MLTDEARAISETQAAAESLEPYRTTEGSQLAAVALAEDLPVEIMRYYPNLGVAYGSVDRGGHGDAAPAGQPRVVHTGREWTRRPCTKADRQPVPRRSQRYVRERGRAVAGADPELTWQLNAAADDTPVEAVIVLRSTGGRPAPDPAQTQSLARELVERVRDSTGHAAEDVHVFRNLGRFVVAADATFLRELLAHIDAHLVGGAAPKR